MSSTSNAQDLLVNVFRPTYKWDSNTGFVPSLVVSNVTEVITSKVKTSALVVSDNNVNTYIGADAGLNASNTRENVGIGFNAMAGSLNATSNVAIGSYALEGLTDSDSNVAIGAKTDISGAGMRNVLIGTNVTLTGGSNNILIGVDLSSATVSNSLQIGTLLYGNLSNGYIGINTSTPTRPLDVSGEVVFRNKVGIQKDNPIYTLDIAGSVYATDQFIGGKGNVSNPMYTFYDSSGSGMYVPVDPSFGTGAFAIAVNRAPAAIFSSNAVNFYQNLDVSGTFSARNIDISAFSVTSGTQSKPAMTFISDLSSGLYLVSSNRIGVSTGGLRRMEILSNGDVSAGRIVAQDISLGGTITTSTTGCNVIGGVTLSNGNVILTGVATNTNLLVPGWFRNTDPATQIDISGGNISNSLTTRSSNFRASSGAVNAPAYSFVSDPSVGLHLVGTSTLGFDTSGVQRMCISGGFVGIGRAAPVVALDVLGDVSATTYNGPGGTQSAPHYTFSDDRTTGLFFPGANIVGLTAGGTERMRISNSNVGIGTTNPSNALDVSGTLRVIGTAGDLTFSNGNINLAGVPVISSTGVLSNGAATSNSIGGVTLSNSNAIVGGFLRNALIPSQFDISGGNISNSGTATSTNFIGAQPTSNVIGGISMSNRRLFSAQDDTFMVAVADGAGGVNTVYTSLDGTSWVSQGAPVFGAWGNGIAWDGSRWVGLGAGGDVIGTTTDVSAASANWVGLGSIMFTTGEGIAANGSLWVAVGSGNGNTIASSSTGSSGWVGQGTSVFSSVGYGIAWGGGLWVAVGAGGNSIATSTTGTSGWAGKGTSVLSTGYGVAWNGKLWIAVGTGSFSIATSADGGATWTGATGTSLPSTLRCVAWNGVMWVAGGNSGGTNNFATSTDGVTWVGRSTSVLSTIRGIAWNGVRWVAVGNGTNRFATSTDGVTWVGAGGGPYNSANAIAARYSAPLSLPLLFDISGGNISNSGTITTSNISYSGTITGSTANTNNSIGGVTLSNFDLSMASTGRILAPIVRNALTPSTYDISEGNISNSALTQSSNFRSSNGTATVPAYSFLSDPSTGVHWAGTSQIAFDTSGVQRMVLSNSVLAIGRTPLADTSLILQTAANAYIATGRVYLGDPANSIAAYGGTIVEGLSNGGGGACDLLLYSRPSGASPTTPLERMRILGPSGFVGIGSSNPETQLQVDSSGVGFSTIRAFAGGGGTGSSNNIPRLQLSSRVDNGTVQYYNITGEQMPTANNYGLSFGGYGNSNVVRMDLGNRRMGINTSVPAYSIDVSNGDGYPVRVTNGKALFDVEFQGSSQEYAVTSLNGYLSIYKANTTNKAASNIMVSLSPEIGGPSYFLSNNVGINTKTPGNLLAMVNTSQIGYANRASTTPANYQVSIADGGGGPAGLYLGAYYSGGVGAASTIQSSDSWNGTINPAPLLLNPVGGAVAINTTDAATYTLNVNGTARATTFIGNGTIPVGGIIMWSGTIAAIPTGWALCDGTNGTPDLLNRFVRGAGTGTSPGATGGSTSVTLTVSNMPPHRHRSPNFYTNSATGTGGISYYGGGTWTTPAANGDIFDEGNNLIRAEGGTPQAVNILNPYYALAYIMRTA